jgi:hypothetical protein
MIRLIFSLFCVLISSVAFGDSQILEVDSLKKVEELSDNTTLCILDIDNTLYRPRQMLGSDEWICYSLKKTTSPEEIDEILTLWEAIHTVCEIIPMEEETVQTVEKIQQKFPTIAMTTRGGKNEITTTKKQLKKLNIDFRRSSPCSEPFSLKKIPRCYFTNGILFTDAHHKGESLLEFLEIAKLSPKKIIYINDHRKPLEEVASSLPEDIDYIGLRITVADKYVKSFDPEIAELELKMWKPILTDNAARKKLNKKAA